MKTRLILALMLVLIAVFGISNAQDDLNPCFSLSAEDCSLVSEATSNTVVTLFGSTSTTVEIDFSFEAADIPESEPFSMSITGAIDVIQNLDAETGINFYGALDIAAEVEGESQEATVEFWLVDDIFYFVDSEEEMLQSIDVVRLIEEGDFEALIEEAASDPAAALEDSPLGAAGLDEDALGALGALITLPGLLDYVRDGNSFDFIIDLGALTDPDNQATIDELIAVVSEADPASGAQLQGNLPLIQMMLEAGVITFSQGYNPDMNIVDSWALEGNFVIATGMMMGDPQLPATTIDFAFNVGLGNFDGVDEITAPEGATDITDTVLEAFGSMMGGMGQ